MDAAQQAEHGVVVMVVDDAHQADQVGAGRQGVVQEAAAHGFRPVAHAGGGEPLRRTGRDGRQVEQPQPQRGGLCRGGE